MREGIDWERMGWDATGPALHAPATLRNRDAILAVLRRVLPETGVVLEVASGSGEHAAWFAGHLPHLAWQPSDPDRQALDSIAAHGAAAGLPNLRMPVFLDAADTDWPVSHTDALVAINLIHIAPWAVTQGLMAGAAKRVSAGGCVILYGPFIEADVATSPGNATFDDDLRARNPAWGLRDRDAVCTCAARHGFALVERVAMPANNLTLVFRRPEPA